MIMVMRWDGVGSRCQSYLDSALGNDAVALLHSRKYLHTLAVALAKRHFLLTIAFGVNLDIDKVDALLLGEGGEGQRDDVGTVLRDEINLGVRALHNVAGVVELEDYGDIRIVDLCRTTVRLDVSAHVGDVVETVAVAGAELCTTYLVKLVEVALRYFGTQIEVLVLGDNGKGLTSFHIVAAIDHTLLDVAAARSCNRHTAGAACALHAGVGELGSSYSALATARSFSLIILSLMSVFARV